MRTLAGGILFALLLSTAGCGARGQLVIVVDTDAPLPAQLLTDPEQISRAAVVDTLRIDRVDDDRAIICIDGEVCVQQLVVPDPSMWPVSFGVATPPEQLGAPLHLRLRLFSSASATGGTFTDPRTQVACDTTDPPPETAIDRLVDFTLPSEGVVTVRVFMASDCRNAPVAFSDPPRTCVDDPDTPVAPAVGIEVIGDDPPRTRAGTWSRARSVACKGSPPNADAVCIPGGFSVLGDAALKDAPWVAMVAADPTRPVYLSPFFIDRTEFTVGRFRTMLAHGLIEADPEDPHPPNSESSFQADCSWAVNTDGRLPLTCIGWSRARAACRAAGGDLPTEAQWEHAASGRGRGLRYPWGDYDARCCTASLSRPGTVLTGGVVCSGVGPEPVGSHPASPACDDAGDESRDHVLDLGGSVSELCLDSWVPYSHPCWSYRGIFVDPRCDASDAPLHTSRGGDWNGGFSSASTAARWDSTFHMGRGFRCVYPDN